MQNSNTNDLFNTLLMPCNDPLMHMQNSTNFINSSV